MNPLLGIGTCFHGSWQPEQGPSLGRELTVLLARNSPWSTRRRLGAQRPPLVNDIDEIVRHVRFEGWQDTHAGEREIKKALRKTLFKYKLHADTDLFDRAYGYIREYY